MCGGVGFLTNYDKMNGSYPGNAIKFLFVDDDGLLNRNESNNVYKHPSKNIKVTTNLLHCEYII